MSRSQRDTLVCHNAGGQIKRYPLSCFSGIDVNTHPLVMAAASNTLPLIGHSNPVKCRELINVGRIASKWGNDISGRNTILTQHLNVNITFNVCRIWAYMWA